MFERFTTEARQAVHFALVRGARAGREQDRRRAHPARAGARPIRGRRPMRCVPPASTPPGCRTLAVAQPELAPLDADSLAVLGIDLDQVRRAAEAAFGPGALDRPAGSPGAPTTRARMTQDAKEAMASGLRVAQSRHDHAIPAGHLLAGLIDQGDNEALRMLAAAGVDPAALRADVLRRMAAQPRSAARLTWRGRRLHRGPPLRANRKRSHVARTAGSGSGRAGAADSPGRSTAARRGRTAPVRSTSGRGPSIRPTAPRSPRPRRARRHPGHDQRSTAGPAPDTTAGMPAFLQRTDQLGGRRHRTGAVGLVQEVQRRVEQQPCVRCSPAG